MEKDFQETLNTIFAKLDQIKDKLEDVDKKVEVISERLKNHIEREDIHHSAPCKEFLDYKKMVWGLFVGFLGLLGTMIVQYFVGR